VGIAAVCLLVHAIVAGASPATDKVLANVKTAPGFKLELFSDEVPGARSLAIGANGTIFVGTRKDRVYAVSTPASAGGKPTVRVIAQGLNMPNGVAFRDGSLYVAEIHRILRFDGIEDALDRPRAPTVVRDDLPKDRHHG